MIRTHSLINTNIFLIGNCLDTGAYQSLIMSMTGYIPGRPPSTHKQLHIITTWVDSKVDTIRPVPEAYTDGVEQKSHSGHSY